MNLAHFFKTAVPDIKWDLCLQMGVKYAVAKLSPELTGKDSIWHYSVLEQAKESFASRGLELIALEGDQFDMTRIKLGLPGREEDAEHYREMLANMDPLLQFHADRLVPDEGGYQGARRRSCDRIRFV